MSAQPFPDQSRTLGALLRAPYRKLSRRLYAALAEAGFPEIRPAHSAVFRNIAPEGSRLTDLAERADLTKQSMAYLVSYLEQHGYVQVKPDPEDARARLVRLTARGRKLVETLLSASEALEKEVGRELGEAKLESLRNQLESLDAVIPSAPQEE